jgi:SpoVK/Ycf46/Vps4 family AAA+-type ATPase
VVGATNRPEDIDPAILRPGRLSTHLEVGIPDEESRHAILQAKLKGVPHDLTGNQLARLASHTTGFSGADIEDLVTKAKRRAARRDARTVSVDDFLTREEHETVRKDDYLESTADMDTSSPENVTDDDSTVGFQ